jgi:glycosyltransferase involved in cell wall biosynthesis
MQMTGSIEVVAVAHQRIGELLVFVQSWVNQSADNWMLTVIHDGPSVEFEQVMSEFAKQMPTKIKYVCTESRFNDYGHSLRQIGIDQASQDYLLLTNADNYFIPRAVEILNTKIGEADVIMFDMVHSHNAPGGRNLPCYSYFETSCARNSIDVSAAIVKTELCKKVGFRDKGFAGDATYFEDILLSGPNLMLAKLPHILFVHN